MSEPTLDPDVDRTPDDGRRSDAHDDSYHDDYDDIVDEEYDDNELWIDDAEYVYIPKESGIVRKVLTALLIVVFLGVGVVGYGGYWAVGQLRGTGEQGGEVSVMIPSGANMAQAAVLLEEKKVIKNATFFRYYAKFKNLNTIKAGEYDRLFENMPIDDAVDRLREDPLPQKYEEITVPEGFTVKGINNRILAAFPEMTSTELDAAQLQFPSRYLGIRPAGEISIEGFLFPATYRVDKTDTADEAKLIDQMADTFDLTADEVGLDKATEKLFGAAGDQLISPYQALIVASMVEKEVKLDEERAKVARVIYNRLARGMPLQIDATTFYCPEMANRTELTNEALNSTTCPYNTRRVPGIPPTPIASPGKASLEAALNPAEGPWIYYVLEDADGRHFFTDKEWEFNQKVAEARRKGLL